jgi:hypothetical protein
MQEEAFDVRILLKAFNFILAVNLGKGDLILDHRSSEDIEKFAVLREEDCCAS